MWRTYHPPCSEREPPTSHRRTYHLPCSRKATCELSPSHTYNSCTRPHIGSYISPAFVCPQLLRLCVPHSCVCVSPTHASNIRSIKHLQLCVCVHGCKPSPGHLSLARVRDPLNFAPPSLHNSIFLTINHRKTQCSADVKMLTCTSLACICAKRAPHSCCSICTLPSNDCDFDWASAWSVPACACASCS